MSARISWTVISSATMDTTVATGTRRPLMQGIPPDDGGVDGDPRERHCYRLPRHPEHHRWDNEPAAR